MKSQKNLKKVFLMTLLAASALGVSSSAYAVREEEDRTRLTPEEQARAKRALSRATETKKVNPWRATDDQGDEPEEQEDHKDPEEAQE